MNRFTTSNSMELHAKHGHGGHLRILAVEDHADVRKGLKALLGVLGHEAVFAVDVQSALALAEEEDFDLLLSDIGLPDGDGWELLRRLRLSGHCPPCAVAMSCLNAPADVAQSESVGFGAHLCKPFSADELAAVLEAAVQGH